MMCAARRTLALVARARCARIVAITLTALVACVAPLRAAALGHTLHPLAHQTSDAVIAGDLALIDAWRARLDSLPGTAQDPWRAAAARGWLEAARQEYLDNDRTGFPQAAFERAVAMVGQIENGTEPASNQSVATAVPPRGTVRVADSLYVRLERMKRDPNFLCAATELANLEIELGWAGNEQVDQGDCKSSAHLARANDLVRVARQKIDACTPPPVVAQRAEPPAPPRVLPTVEELRIARNVHFALARADISPASHAVVAGIAALLAKYPSITMRLEGHTDSRGDAAYNLALSRRRVMATRAEFETFGIDTTRMSIAYKGKSELYASEDSKRGYALNRRVEMVFVDPEGRDIQTTRQEGDLQIESDRPQPPSAPVVPAPRRAAKPAPSSRKK
jgi:outer membrane protein OmpA-like peptidoglycan-associated protein